MGGRAATRGTGGRERGRAQAESSESASASDSRRAPASRLGGVSGVDAMAGSVEVGHRPAAAEVPDVMLTGRRFRWDQVRGRPSPLGVGAPGTGAASAPMSTSNAIGSGEPTWGCEGPLGCAGSGHAPCDGTSGLGMATSSAARRPSMDSTGVLPRLCARSAWTSAARASACRPASSSSAFGAASSLSCVLLMRNPNRRRSATRACASRKFAVATSTVARARSRLLQHPPGLRKRPLLRPRRAVAPGGAWREEGRLPSAPCNRNEFRARQSCWRRHMHTRPEVPVFGEALSSSQHSPRGDHRRSVRHGDRRPVAPRRAVRRGQPPLRRSRVLLLCVVACLCPLFRPGGQPGRRAAPSGLPATVQRHPC